MKKNIIWGIMILIFAFLYLLNALDMIQNFNIIKIAIMSVLGVNFIEGIYKKSVSKIIYSLTFLYYLGAGFVGLPELGFFTLLIFSTLLQIGITLILGNKLKIFVIKTGNNHSNKHTNNYSNNYTKKNIDIDFNEGDSQDNENISITTTFGETKRYISSEDFKSCNISSTFGDVTIYFDNVTIKGESATVNVSVNFGDVTLYVPKNWHVNVEASLVFADSKVEKNDNLIYDKTLGIMGSINFGDIKIKRI